MPRKKNGEPQAQNGGRDPLFTPEVASTILELIEKTGLSRARTCEFIGINERTLARWAKSDSDFADRLRVAELNLEVKLLNEVRNGMTGKDYHDWKASAWLLARKWPKQYSEKIQQEITGKDGGPVEIIKAYKNVDLKKV